MQRRITDALSGLPLILRFGVAGWLCASTLGTLFVVVNVIENYALADVIPAMVFGVFEAFFLVGIPGGCIGLVVGLIAYLARAATHRRA